MRSHNKLCALAGLSLFSMVASAQTTVDVDATVVSVDDPQGVLTGVNVGDVISGQYIYESATPDMEPDPYFGYFDHDLGTGGMNLTLGAYQFVTDASSYWPLSVYVNNSAVDPMFEGYHAVTLDVLPTNGLNIDYVNINFDSYGGDALVDDQLHETPPDITQFNGDRSVSIYGSANGQYFTITAALQSFGGGNPPSPETQTTYKVTAQVDAFYDDSGTLDGRVMVGNVITVYYTLDPSTPDSDPSPDIGSYVHAPGAGSLVFELPDGTRIESDSQQATPLVDVYDDAGMDFMGIYSNMLVSSDASLTLQDGWVSFSSYYDVITDDSLNLQAMLSSDWASRNIGLYGSNWMINAIVINVEAMPSQLVEVVPGDATIHPLQRFDMAAHVSNSPGIVAVGGRINGMPIDTYLQGCMIDQPKNGNQSVVCSDTHQLLAPGQNTLELDIFLEDMSVVNETVKWNLK